MGLGIDDDLRFLIDGGHTGIALNYALAGGHFGGIIVAAIGLANAVFAATAIFRMFLEPVAQLLRFLLQPFQLFCFALVDGLIGRRVVRTLVLRQHLLGGTLHARRLALIVGAGAGFGLAGIGGEFDAIDGKHLAADQALALADQENLREQFGDAVMHARDKGGECGEVRLAVTRDGDEQDILG